MSDPLDRLRLDYRSALVGFLSVRGETQLASAYELGRAAMLGHVGLLELVQLHNSVTLDLVRAAAGAAERLEIAEAAAAFLVEVLASSDMARRGFLESARGSGDDPA
ncbi:MAG TPA: phosphatase RsbU N-terminal domain-containing protein [Mycobacteriales bacterium]|nr:phosphatase RsbU N-terminal domain-containing protein [Mycobacteriales bacterium]